MHKTIKEIIRDIEANGYVVDRSGSHPKIRNKDGHGTLGVLPTSPSGARWEKNLRSQLRRRGILSPDRF